MNTNTQSESTSQNRMLGGTPFNCDQCGKPTSHAGLCYHCRTASNINQNPKVEQKPDLTQILDEIEEDNAATRQGYPTFSACLDHHLRSELALVKALRRAIWRIEHPPKSGTPEMECYWDEVEETTAEITAILNQGRKTETLEES